MPEKCLIPSSYHIKTVWIFRHGFHGTQWEDERSELAWSHLDKCQHYFHQVRTEGNMEANTWQVPSKYPHVNFF